MMNERIAQHEYYSRPDDQKYGSVDALRAAALTDKTEGATARLYTRDIRIAPAPDPRAGLHLIGPTGTAAEMTPWAFGQLCSYLQAPRDYIRRQAPELASACLNADAARAHRIGPNGDDDRGFREDHKLLLRMRGDQAPIVRAITSQKYRRLWDVDLIDIVNQTRATRPALDLPPIWEGGKGGAYRSDRDMFLLLTDGGSIVNDPTVRNGDGSMYRGLIVTNSETGARPCRIRAFWFRTICGNLLLTGTEQVIDFNRRHVGRHFESDVARALRQSARWLERPESEDRRLIDAAIATPIGASEQDAIENLTRWLKIPESTASAAMRAATANEANPRTIWGAFNGLTRISQDSTHFADRLELDSLAARLMQRVKVAAA